MARWKGIHAATTDSVKPIINQYGGATVLPKSIAVNEWTGNPDIDNAIIMLDRIDTLEKIAMMTVLRLLRPF
uniref:hypothetical protein n=1 Tax=Salmonella sp. TaxID=599 RepID=UPI002981073F|nr:hypothetical protein [Salmonella sp.]